MGDTMIDKERLLPILAGLFLISLALLAASSNSEAATYIRPDQTCELPGGRIGRSSPVAVDLNNDGILEVITAAGDGWVYAVDMVNNCRILWQKQLANYINPVASNPSAQAVESSPAVADLNGDGYPEIILTTGWMPEYHMNGAIVVLDRHGNLMPGWPKLARDINGGGNPPWNPDGYADGFFGTAAVGDVTGNGVPEIVVGGFDKCIYVLKNDGTFAPGWGDAQNRPARCLIDTIWSSPALADLDGDGVNEIIIGTDAHPQYNGGSVWVFKGDNTLFPGWPVYTTQIIQSSPAIADLDGDGYLDIIVGTGTYYPGTGGYKMYAFNRFGNNLPGWPVATSGNMPNSPAVADLNGDGRPEVIMGCGAEQDVGNSAICNNNHFYIWRHDGTVLPGYPARIKQAIPWDPPAYGGVAIPPILADYDNSGKVRVFVVSTGAIGVSVFPYDNPQDITMYTPALTDPLRAAPILADLNGDGKLEMITAGGKNGRAALFRWNLTSREPGNKPWMMYRANPSRTGQSQLPPRLEVRPGSINLMHQHGCTLPEKATLQIYNAGSGEIQWQLQMPPNTTASQTSGVATHQVTEVEITIQTSCYTSMGTFNVGNLAVSGTVNGAPAAASPVSIPIRMTIGNISRVFLPLTVK